MSFGENLDKIYAEDMDACYDKDYQPLIISDRNEITKLIDNINNLKYIERDSDTVGICGFKYYVMWNSENDSSIIGIFEKKGKLYIRFGNSIQGFRLKSSIDFFDQYEIEEK